MRVIIIGGGWSGCAAALSAYKQGAQVILLERTDMLLGTGLVGGVMRNNGRFTATEEMTAMGAGELFQLADQNARHRDIDFPGHQHALIYDVATMEPIVRRFLTEKNIKIHFLARIDEVEMEGPRIKAVSGKSGHERIRFDGDVFVDTTGTAGPPANCTKHGNGCAMCILRCPSFGGRVSISAKAGVKEMAGMRGEELGAMSGSTKLLKESLSQEIRKTLNEKGVAVIPIPPPLRMKGELLIKCCQQYAIPDFEENIILLDSGHAKLMAPFFPLEVLRQIPGCEYARYEDPYAGSKGNSIRYIGMAPRDDVLRVESLENLFCGGEKAGLFVGHTEAIVTGTLAGYNAVCHLNKKEPLVLSSSLAVGDIITFAREQMKTEEGLNHKFTFSGAVYFDRMKKKGLYSVDVKTIKERVSDAGMTRVFAEIA